MTPSQLIDRIADALTRPGSAAHITARYVVSDGLQTTSATEESWLDLAHGVSHVTTEPSGGEDFGDPQNVIVVGGSQYLNYGGDREVERISAPDCLGKGRSVLARFIELLSYNDSDCLFFNGGFQTSVDPTADLSGKDVLTLQATGGVAGPDEGVFSEIAYRLLVDPNTFFPLAASVSVDSSIGGNRQREQVDVSFALEFVPLETLASGFFDPASIGYVQPVLKLNDLEGVIYWLGEELPAADGYPALTLDSVWNPERAVEPGAYIGILDYDPDLALHEYVSGNLDFWREPQLAGDCLVETVNLDLDGVPAVIWGETFKTDDSSCGSVATHWEARVFFPETIVSAFTSENTEAPLDSREALEYVIRHLTRQE